MADYDPIVVVPKEDPEQTAIIDTGAIDNPWRQIWWTPETVSDVPENVMGWLVAQGWQITLASPDNSTVPPTITYALKKQSLDSAATLLQLCNSYTDAANDARYANALRYSEVVTNWTEMIASSQTQFKQQITQQNADLGVYITDLDSYMDAIDTLIAENRDGLELDYGTHKLTANGLLTDLGTTEVARINELFASTLAVQLQGLTDRGLYSSGVATDITERNHRDRDEQLQKHYDSLAREQLGNEHLLWNQRVQLSEQANQAIVQRMNTSVARLDGWKSVAADNQKLMAYQLDVRNQLLIGLYSFVERREDIAPEWKDMSQMIANLGDSGTAWVTP